MPPLSFKIGIQTVQAGTNHPENTSGPGQEYGQPWLAGASEAELHHIVEAMYRVHGFMAALTDLDTLLERIGEEGRAVVGAEAASVMLYDESAGELYFHVVLGEKGNQDVLKEEVRLKLGQGIAGTAARTLEAIHVPDVERDPRFFRGADAASEFRTRNLLAVPMMERGRLVGVLELVNKIDGESFTPIDRHVMEVFSALAATAVVNARLIEEQIKNARLAAIGQAIAGLTHHIKNILTGLASSVELIDMALQKNDIPLVTRTWPILHRSTARISNFVQDMLLVAKPRKPRLEKCFAHKILAEVCDSVSELCSQKAIALDIHAPVNVDPIVADPEALMRCLLNLVVNALDAAPRQGGRVLVSLSRNLSGALEITVEDNGPGIPPELRPRVFDIFFSTKGARGTGLGLACSSKIAQEHGGTLELLDTGQGACFKLTLPAIIQNAETFSGETYEDSENP